MRKETQDVLAELLRQQETLEEMNVEQWAESEYTRALQAAEQGDADYREREFEGAQNQIIRLHWIYFKIYTRNLKTITTAQWIVAGKR